MRRRDCACGGVCRLPPRGVQPLRRDDAVVAPGGALSFRSRSAAGLPGGGLGGRRPSACALEAWARQLQASWARRLARHGCVAPRCRPARYAESALAGSAFPDLEIPIVEHDQSVAAPVVTRRLSSTRTWSDEGLNPEARWSVIVAIHLGVVCRDVVHPGEAPLWRRANAPTATSARGRREYDRQHPPPAGRGLEVSGESRIPPRALP